ncbi:hypothetical protein Dimus_013058 [Dionaea muscipula]
MIIVAEIRGGSNSRLKTQISYGGSDPRDQGSPWKSHHKNSQWNWGLENTNEAAINNKDAEMSWERAIGEDDPAAIQDSQVSDQHTDSHDQPTQPEVPVMSNTNSRTSDTPAESTTSHLNLTP